MGKKITTGINKTDNDMEIREFCGLIPDTNDCINMTDMKAGENTDIDVTKYGGSANHGGKPSYVMIFCNGSFLKSRSCTGSDFLLAGGELGLSGQRFIHSKTVTIETVAEDGNFVNYKVTFKPRDASAGLINKTDAPANPTHLEVFSDSVLNHDNGWSVHCNIGSVKLTRKEGMTMTLDPSKLFATVVDPTETSLMRVVLKFWPRTFADLNCKDDLGTTIGIVNYLMRQAQVCHVNESKVEDDEVVKKVDDLHKSCAAMVEWYRPLFRKMKDRFPEVDPEKLKKFEEKLKEFETTIKPML